MAKSKLKLEQEARAKEQREAVYTTFAERLKGQCIADAKGPNNSELQWWTVGNRLVIVQIWANGDGWEYYVAGQNGKYDDIVKELSSDPPHPGYVNTLRLNYAGAVGLLCQVSPQVDEEKLDLIERAVSDWCGMTGWTMQRTVNGVDVFPPAPANTEHSEIMREVTGHSGMDS